MTTTPFPHIAQPPPLSRPQDKAQKACCSRQNIRQLRTFSKYSILKELVQKVLDSWDIAFPNRM